MRDGAGKLDVTHAITSHFGQSYFNAALLANHPTVLQPLVFAAQAFIVFHWSKNLGTEQTITFRLESSVIDGLRLLYFTE